SARPGALGPAARVGRAHQARAADGRDERRHARIIGAASGEAAVARRDEDAGLGRRWLEVGALEARYVARLRPAPAVAYDGRAGVGGRVLRDEEAVALIILRLDQEQLAAGAGGAGHVEVERGLDGPIVAGRRRRRQRRRRAVLVDDPQAAVGFGARRQAKLRAIRSEVALGVRIAKGVHDG